MEDFLGTFENEPISKPRNVKLAIILIVLVTFIATLNFISKFVFLGINFSFIKNAIPFLISFFMYLFLAFQINLGRNWARILYIVLIVLFIIIVLSDIIRSMSGNQLSTLILIIEILLELVATVLLLTKSSNRWFRAKK